MPCAMTVKSCVYMMDVANKNDSQSQQAALDLPNFLTNLGVSAVGPLPTRYRGTAKNARYIGDRGCNGTTAVLLYALLAWPCTTFILFYQGTAVKKRARNAIATTRTNCTNNTTTVIYRDLAG